MQARAGSPFRGMLEALGRPGLTANVIPCLPTPEVTADNNTPSVPPELQVYVLSPYLPDSTVERDRNPRSFSPTKMSEYLNLPDKVRRRLKSPLPELLKSAREGKPIDMKANEPPYPGASDADYCAWESDNFFIFSRRAADMLHHLLAPAGTFLPLEYAEAALVGYMIDAVDDALDTSTSRIDWLTIKNSRLMMSIDRYAFHTERLGRFAIFRPAGNGPALKAPLVLQPFVDIVRGHRFAGFNFCRIWPAGEKKWWHHEQWI